MKTSILSPVLMLLLMLSSSSNSSSEYRGEHELKEDQPLLANLDEFSRLKLDKATGSIGFKTFSLLPHMEILEIVDSTIDQISDGALCSSPNLTELYIYSNRKFPPIDRQLFENCGKIEVLAVTNILPRPDIFWDLKNLTYLQIIGSTFQFFTEDYLKPLTKLRNFVLEDCEIGQIDSNAFCVSPSQEILELIDVSIPQAINRDIFENCASIQNLYISFSQGYKLIEEDALVYFPNLVSLTLGHLRIHTLTKTFFARLSKLERANLNSNKIERIDNNAFEDLKNLEELSQNYNNIQSLDPRIFQNLQGLRVLSLRMTGLFGMNDIGSLPNLRELYLGYNKIDGINVIEIEEKFPSLRILEIRKNPADNYETRAAFARRRIMNPYFNIMLT